MNRPTFTVLVFTLVLGAYAQGPKSSPKPSPVAPAEVSPSAVAPDASAAAPTPEDVIARRAVPYRPTLTRDPFSSPSDDQPTSRGDMVDDIAVKGMIKKDGKFFAVVSDSRGNVRWLPVGYNFRDGQIVSIDEKIVTFHQWDPNSTVRTQFKTVTKTFKREEGKR